MLWFSFESFEDKTECQTVKFKKNSGPKFELSFTDEELEEEMPVYIKIYMNKSCGNSL